MSGIHPTKVGISLFAASGCAVACVAVIGSAAAFGCAVVVAVAQTLGSARSHHTVEKNAVFIVDDAQVQFCHKFFERFFFVFHLGVMSRVRSMLLFAIILIMYLVNKKYAKFRQN